MNKNLVLVTGGTGALGKYVVPALAKAGYALRLIVLEKDSWYEKYKPEVVQLDLTTATPEELEKACKGVTYVVHMAGLVDFTLPQEKIYAINALPAGCLAQAAEKQGVKKLVFASSTSLYHVTDGETNEDSPLTPANAYGKSKIKAEELIRESGVPFIFLRITSIYGAGFNKGFLEVSKMIKKNKMFILGDGENLISLVHASDVANAFVKAIESNVSNEAFIISGPSIRQVDCLNELAELLGVEKPKRKVSVPIALLLAYLDGFLSLFTGKRRLYPEYVKVLSSDRVFNCFKAKKMLGWEAKVEFKDGAEEFVSSILNKV